MISRTFVAPDASVVLRYLYFLSLLDLLSIKGLLDGVIYHKLDSDDNLLILTISDDIG